MQATESRTPTGISESSFHAFLETRQEPPWLRDHRRQAWRIFSEGHWPNRSEEEWARTDIRLFKPDAYGLPRTRAAADSAVPQALLAAGVTLAGQSTAVDSVAQSNDLSPEWAARGVLFGSLDQWVQSHGDLLRPYLTDHAVPATRDRFAAWNAACWSGGHLLYVPRGVCLHEPLLALSAMSDGGVDFGHLLVILEEGAEATLLSETASVGSSDNGLHCGVTTICLQPGAHLRFVSLQNWGSRTWHFAHQRATLQRDASLQWTLGALGARLAKVNQQVLLQGKGAECQVNGVMFTEDRQHLSYHTLQHHQAPQCRSDFLYKSALQDKSHTVWRGMIKVDREAQQTDGYQRNDNLLLSHDARADSIPGLEIEADDVRCTHGSTTGRVNEELIFYARCRGFTRREAVRLIVTGFFQQVLDRITIESVREALGHAIARRVREYD